jgi:hypothetical protein
MCSREVKIVPLISALAIGSDSVASISVIAGGSVIV